MEINVASNNQPLFRGNVGKSVFKYIDRAVKNESQIILNEAKTNNQEIDKKQIIYLSCLGAKIQNRLTRYMRSAHDNTIFEMGNTNFRSYPRFKNSISSHIVRIYAPLSGSSAEIDSCGEISIPKLKSFSPLKEAGMKDLVNFSKLCEALENKICAKNIDKAFYNIEKSKLIKNQNESQGLFSSIRNIIKDIKISQFLKDSKKNQRFE